jgi:hypothetical protein
MVGMKARRFKGTVMSWSEAISDQLRKSAVDDMWYHMDNELEYFKISGIDEDLPTCQAINERIKAGETDPERILAKGHIPRLVEEVISRSGLGMSPTEWAEAMQIRVCDLEDLLKTYGDIDSAIEALGPGGVPIALLERMKPVSMLTIASFTDNCLAVPLYGYPGERELRFP